MSIVNSITQSADVFETRIEQFERQGREMERKSEAGQKNDSYVAAKDEYVPGQAPASAGLYRLSKDENGTLNIVFDSSSQGEVSPAERLSDDQRAEMCTVSTDKVDAEIKQLKETAASLEAQISQAADDPVKVEKLQNQLQQIMNEISHKDNDAYRRKHATYS